VNDKIKKIEIEEVLLGWASRLDLVNNYLIISDGLAYDEVIHIFDKNNFEYLTSVGYRGQGPGEIANMGTVVADKERNTLYVSDHGKHRVFSYHLDSIFANPRYMPEVKIVMQERLFPVQYIYINDTLSYGRIIQPTGNYGYTEFIGKWNMLTGEITPMKYTHPKIEKKRAFFTVSMENNIVVEVYHHHDLMTILDLDGNLKYNIYGRGWDSTTSNARKFYGKVMFVKDKIFTLFSNGREQFIDDRTHDIPTEFLVFDINGNYLKTLEVGSMIMDFNYDEENGRIILHLDDEMQFAYFELDGII
jgi:hypothetical protein